MTGSVGVLINYGSHARLRTGLTYNQLVSGEVLLQFFPLGDDASSLNPYVQAGWGRYFADSDQGGGGVLPIGLGLEYALSDRIGLTAEVERRWGAVQLSSPEVRGTLAGWLPTLGLTYKLSDFSLRSSDDSSPSSDTPTAVSADASASESDDQSSESTATGDDEETSFRDPVAVPSEDRSTNYTRDSLKQSPPLRIDRWDPAPYESPGAPVGAGAPEVVEDGDMVRLPSGVFIMGLTAPDPLDLQTAGRKRVSLSPFYIDRFEVTNEEYRAYLNAMVDEGELTEQEAQERLPDSTAFRDSRARWRSYFYSDSNADRPVVAVTWEEARQYCKWEDKRLPTEAEWEYAARGGRTGGLYPWAGVFAQHDGQYLANFNPERQGQAADGYAFTAPVGSFPPNRWGLHDVAGNAAEWVGDAYTPSYAQLPSLNPAYRDSTEQRHVVRGGSYASRSFNIGVGKRSYQDKDEASTRIGFRCAADVGQIEEEGASEAPGFTPSPSPGENESAPSDSQTTDPGAGEDDSTPRS
ncbi:MAG: SUMF1/EgtB/PvdO family nonheme iron enzyme [Salinibacter sp.]